ncbi:hypothetical protein [Kaistella jeonii]|uniref:Molecular chaperone GroES n=1 Tax=Kaistella jeonii TaxID=266749 RepID=A0A0C1FC60_9FLAO|nr:hypothetical protein [Kaistella jeonii]KIA89453.1 hypothetical protein OA86_07450 [Kaistella jeonii]SFC05094.1 hypothetical protein SAMN05421876_105224 [Kaistella jeonii]VEI96752.1 Uncharacterised protein [Kaistella jeonii]
MKKLIYLSILFFAQMFFGQTVILNKVLKSNTNSDKILYKIDPEKVTSEYLGELEVQGFSDDDVKVFGMIYKKAKEIGANAFSYQPFETVDGSIQKFDYAHYRLNLYYVPANTFPKEDNIIYLIASPYKKQSIAVNKDNIVFQPRTYIKKTLSAGEIITISTKKLLGSTIKLAGQENQPIQYFQFSAFSVNSNPYGTAGVNVKSGDITRLEQSYGQFLTTIYEEFK